MSNRGGKQGHKVTPKPQINGFEPAYARVICPHHRGVYLTHEEYTRQLEMPGEKWRCPRCGAESTFDDHWFDVTHSQIGDEPTSGYVEEDK